MISCPAFSSLLLNWGVEVGGLCMYLVLDGLIAAGWRQVLGHCCGVDIRWGCW